MKTTKTFLRTIYFNIFNLYTWVQCVCDELKIIILVKQEFYILYKYLQRIPLALIPFNSKY